MQQGSKSEVLNLFAEKAMATPKEYYKP